MGTSGSYNPIGAGIVGVNNQTGTSYVLVVTDAGKLVRINNANAVFVTVPPNVFTVNTVITIEQAGAGEVVAWEGVGVTINALNDGKMTAGQYAAIQLVQVAANVWSCYGGIESTVATTTTPAATTTTTPESTTTTTP